MAKGQNAKKEVKKKSGKTQKEKKEAKKLKKAAKRQLASFTYIETKR